MTNPAETGAPIAPAETAVLLEITGLHKRYRLGDDAVAVLRGLDLAVRAGEMAVIMGPSGAGKTTLLNCISGIDVPDAGQVSLSGVAVDYGSEAARTLLRRNRIGMVFQFFNLIPTLSVTENIALPQLIAGGAGGAERARVEALVEEVGLRARRDHYPHQLSGGEMQLVSIARALVKRPDLVLADEPTGNVNPRVGRSIMNILRRSTKQQGAGVLMVTHSPEHAAWADRICFLRDGVIVGELAQEGRVDDLAPIHQRLLDLGI